MTERRKQQLRLEGINIEKILEMTENIIREMQMHKVTVKESKLIINELSCVIANIEKRSSDTPLSEIVTLDY
ncbi:hypothetical protein QA584_17475 [Anaerocolumna sp. AGMB13025]|uniref:hypothetical protein n=1 Tax=Anaerocolumna sp. AGMB13025 TaxID=3039116 RepID=UPI00241E3D8B|nr:hypothetical protein [Anaerocolumna sp. AGMB13025]WFR55392.1 hypothetical protein QA584_17475 [Anaerocolumna sp. AGMB13025]